MKRIELEKLGICLDDKSDDADEILVRLKTLNDYHYDTFDVSQLGIASDIDDDEHEDFLETLSEITVNHYEQMSDNPSDTQQNKKSDSLLPIQSALPELPRDDGSIWAFLRKCIEYTSPYINRESNWDSDKCIWNLACWTSIDDGRCSALYETNDRASTLLPMGIDNANRNKIWDLLISEKRSPITWVSVNGLGKTSMLKRGLNKSIQQSIPNDLEQGTRALCVTNGDNNSHPNPMISWRGFKGSCDVEVEKLNDAILFVVNAVYQQNQIAGDIDKRNAMLGNHTEALGIPDEQTYLPSISDRESALFMSLTCKLRSSDDMHPKVEVRWKNLKAARKNIDKFNVAKAYLAGALLYAPKFSREYYQNASRGWSYWDLVSHDIGGIDNAFEYFEKALIGNLKTLGDNSLNVATLWGNLGEVCREKGQYDKAIDYFEKALLSDLEYFGEENPTISNCMNNLALAWHCKGDVDRAIEYYEKALNSDLKMFGEDHPNVSIHWNNLGAAWDSKGNYDKAINYFKKALASDLMTYGQDHPNVATTWNNLGLAYHSKGELNKAIDYYEKTLASDLKTFGEDHPTVATTLNNLGLAFKGIGKYYKAISYYERALKIREDKLGSSDPYTLMTKDQLNNTRRLSATCIHIHGEYPPKILWSSSIANKYLS